MFLFVTQTIYIAVSINWCQSSLSSVTLKHAMQNLVVAVHQLSEEANNTIISWDTRSEIMVDMRLYVNHYFIETLSHTSAQ